jgi:hypothetical protein
MINSRITSGFDIELQLGANWFRTALELLVEKGVIDTGGLPVMITNIQVIMDPVWDLQIDILGLPAPLLARAELNDAGTELTITTNNPLIPEQRVPFGALKDLAERPAKVKLEGDTDHENVIGILANLNIHAEPQSQEPLSNGKFLERGDPGAAQSFLPVGKDIAFGMSGETLQRFANNIWHMKAPRGLRADDGSHPLPNEENEKGEWAKVTGRAEDGNIRMILEGDIPEDSPLIDIVPDPHVKITLTLSATLDGGKLIFTIDTDTDVDTGLLGDLFGGLVGGAAGAIVGLIVGVFTGGILIAVLVGAGIGLGVGVITVEVVEYVVEGIVQRQIKAKIDGEPVADIHCCDESVVHFATPTAGDTFNLSVLDAIPSSVSIHNDNPEDEFLYKENLLVTSVYDDLTIDSDGFGVAGLSGRGELFEPEIVSVRSFNYSGEVLESITYVSADGQDQTLAVDQVLARVGEGELRPPFKILIKPEEAVLRVPQGKLACVCLKPVRIRREDTVVEEIEFEPGTRLRVADAVALQDAGAILMTGYQLIHPRDYNAYYRATADFSKDNNLESLPEFA